jgi:hypothetical protein
MSIDTVNDLPPRVQYVASAAQTVFPYPFPVFQDADLEVYVDGALQALTTDYTVDGEGDDTGGDVTFVDAMVGDEIVTILRDIAIDRTTDISQNGQWQSAAYNDEMDKVYLILQQLKSNFLRSLRIPVVADVDDADIELTVANFANTYLSFDADGKPTPAVLSATTMTQTIIGALLYPRTPEEITAGITPTSYAYFGLDVRRYGAIGNGIADDRQAFQDAIDVARTRGGRILIPPPSDTYLIEGALDLTAPVGAVASGFIFCGEGNSNSAVTGYPATITLKHTGHAFDCTGSLGLTLRDLSIGTDLTTFPKTCFLLARNTDERSQVVHMHDVTVRGKFSEAIVYNYGSEEDEYHACSFKNIAGGANSKVMVFTGWNIRSLTSTFTTIASGQQSTIDHKIFGGEFYNQTNHADGDVFVLDNILSLKIFGAWMGCGSESAGTSPRSLIYVNATNGNTNLVALRDITGEHSTVFQTYGIRFGGEAVRQHSKWIIDGGTFPNVTAAISAHVDAECFGFDIRSPDIQSVGGGLAFPGLLRNSIIEDTVNTITIGTSRNNSITAQSSSLTVTTRDGDIWHDVATRTWTPANVDMVVTGALTVSNTRFEYHGKQVTATLIMSAATSIVAAAGATISGLPRAALIGAGQVIVENHTDKTVIGFGHVSGTTIVLPAINETTDQIAITATYFVA